eukprot:COSAG05_NODE_466_length_9533_cov_5.547806_6_plen_379_part_00
MATRLEHDLLGDREVDNSRYYGIQTVRAVDNYQVTDIPISHFPNFPKGLAMVKKAAALANLELGLIPEDVADAIIRACDLIIGGALLDEFVVDMIQGGAGTSTNMNANEVIANLALELLGEPKGSYTRVHPNDHVNRSQSTNDAYPTAIKLAVLLEHRSLQAQMEQLVTAFRAKGGEFSSILKMGRTQLQDAVPMTLGQEFNSWAATIEADLGFLEQVSRRFYTVNMGGTAIGTGIASVRGFSASCVRHLRTVTGLPIEVAADLIEETANTGGFMAFSGIRKSGRRTRRAAQVRLTRGWRSQECSAGSRSRSRRFAMTFASSPQGHAQVRNLRRLPPGAHCMATDWFGFVWVAVQGSTRSIYLQWRLAHRLCQGRSTL